MLENKIKELSKKIVLAVVGIALNLSCGPEYVQRHTRDLTVPTRVPSLSGYVITGRKCCGELHCYTDMCNEGIETHNMTTGIYETYCSCTYTEEVPIRKEEPVREKIWKY